jgi:hypothetical protein
VIYDPGLAEGFAKKRGGGEMEKFNILRDRPVMAWSVSVVGEGLTACGVGVRQGRIGWECRLIKNFEILHSCCAHPGSQARPTRSSFKTDKKT